MRRPRYGRSEGYVETNVGSVDLIELTPNLQLPIGAVRPSG